MATADTEEHHSERECGHTLFSRQYFGQLIVKIIRIDSVVQKFIDSKTISDDECKSLSNLRIADQKLRHLLTIINDNCNRNSLLAFRTFIDILGDTGNCNVAQNLSVIYIERENYVATLNLLSKEKSLVRNLRKEISDLKTILGGKERYIKGLTDEKNKLVDEEKTFREENLSLKEQIKKKEEYLLSDEKKMGKLTSTINDLETEAEHKSNVIREIEKKNIEEEGNVREAIAESNRLRFKIDTLQQQQSAAVVEDRDMSKEIEILESEIDEKEKIIMNLRKDKTMTLGEIQENLGNITKGQENKLDDLTKKVGSQAIMMKEQSKQIAGLMEAVTRALNLQENKQ